MKLITEIVDQVGHLEEDTGGQKSHYITGPFLQAGTVNRNRRVYPPAVMEREANKYIQEKIKNGNSFGELDHPANSPGVKLQNVSHIITELHRDGNIWHGKAKLINEGMGKIAIGIIQAGGKLGVSSRGMGSLKPDPVQGYNIVQDDFRLHVAADIVSDPSCQIAVVNGIVENLDWVLNDLGEWVSEESHNIRKEVRRDNPGEARKLQMFESFVASITEGKTVEKLASMAGVDGDKALAAWKRAKVHAKLVGSNDPNLVYHKAREFLGLPVRTRG